MTIAYRPAEIDDAPFIVSSWSRTYKVSKSSGIIADEDWPRYMHATLQKLLARPGVRTIVAYENTAPDFIYGYIAATTTEAIPVVYWVYVKEAYRRAGYARGLFAAMGIDPSKRFVYTCWTPVIKKLSGKIHADHEPGFAKRAGFVMFEQRSTETSWKR